MPSPVNSRAQNLPREGFTGRDRKALPWFQSGCGPHGALGGASAPPPAVFGGVRVAPRLAGRVLVCRLGHLFLDVVAHGFTCSLPDYLAKAFGKAAFWPLLTAPGTA